MQRPDDDKSITKIVEEVLSGSGYTESRGAKMDIDDLLTYVTLIPLGIS